MIRVHQFNKVEQFSLTRPEDSWDELELLLANTEELVQALGLPYRVVVLPAGDMSSASAKTYDVEIWFPSQGRYRETASISNTTDFQARRLMIRSRGEHGPELVHMLNGTAVVDRMALAILENFQGESRTCSATYGAHLTAARQLKSTILTGRSDREARYRGHMRHEGDVRVLWTRPELIALKEAIEVTPNFEGRQDVRDILDGALRAPRFGEVEFDAELAELFETGSSRSTWRPRWPGRSCSAPCRRRAPAARCRAATRARRRRRRQAARAAVAPTARGCLVRELASARSRGLRHPGVARSLERGK